MNRKIKTEVAIGLLIAAVIIAAAIIWLVGKQKKITNVPVISLPSTIHQNVDLQNLCLSKSGKLENWQESNGQLTMKCRLPNQQLCGLDDLYSGRCPAPLPERYFVPHNAVCQEYSSILEKIGEVSRGTKDINPYHKNMHGNLCAITAEKMTYLKDYYQQRENKIVDYLEKEGWKDSARGGDLGSISKGGSSSIFEKDGAVLIFERGYERDSAQVEACQEKDRLDQGNFDSCVNRLEQKLRFTLMIGKETSAH